jgi:sec-independent protein translocase protein TatB
MFDFAWSEIALIGVVALIAIGPKDMPVAIRAISDTIKKMRRMAGEFQGHLDEMMREADLGDMKSTISELRSVNLKSTVKRALDPDGTLDSAFADPFGSHPVRPPVMTPAARTILPRDTASLPAGPAPAFIPPGAVPPAPLQPDSAPAFIPPAAASERS